MIEDEDEDQNEDQNEDQLLLLPLLSRHQVESALILIDQSWGDLVPRVQIPDDLQHLSQLEWLALSELLHLLMLEKACSQLH
jgi:hypothetical protein